MGCLQTDFPLASVVIIKCILAAVSFDFRKFGDISRWVVMRVD
jgi:hypothetical protein